MIRLGGRGMRCGKIILLGAEVKRYNSILNDCFFINFYEHCYKQDLKRIREKL